MQSGYTSPERARKYKPVDKYASVFRQKPAKKLKPLDFSRGFGDSVESLKSAAPLHAQQIAEAFGPIRLE